MQEKTTIKRRSFLVGLTSLLSVFIPIRIPINIGKGFERGSLNRLEGKTVRYKGRSTFDSPYIYAPYMPLIVTKYPINNASMTQYYNKVVKAELIKPGIFRRDSFRQLFGLS